MTDRTHDRNRLLYWKKIIQEAEAYDGTNIDWMCKHGITEGSYYYWHRVLRKEGMLDREDEPELKEIPLPELVEKLLEEETLFPAEDNRVSAYHQYTGISDKNTHDPGSQATEQDISCAP